MEKETITVTYSAKYGPKIGDVFYSLSPKSGLTPKNFEVGKTYQVLVYTSKTGKKYINQIVGEGTAVLNGVPTNTISAQTTEKLEDKPSLPPAKEILDNEKPSQIESLGLKAAQGEYKKRDFDAEARGKVACAIFTSLLQSPFIASQALNKEDAIKLIDELGERYIKKVFEKQGTL